MKRKGYGTIDDFRGKLKVNSGGKSDRLIQSKRKGAVVSSTSDGLWNWHGVAHVVLVLLLAILASRDPALIAFIKGER